MLDNKINLVQSIKLALALGSDAQSSDSPKCYWYDVQGKNHNYIQILKLLMNIFILKFKIEINACPGRDH